MSEKLSLNENYLRVKDKVPQCGGWGGKYIESTFLANILTFIKLDTSKHVHWTS